MEINEKIMEIKKKISHGIVNQMAKITVSKFGQKIFHQNFSR
jgi:hypothetical protein